MGMFQVEFDGTGMWDVNPRHLTRTPNVGLLPGGYKTGDRVTLVTLDQKDLAAGTEGTVVGDRPVYSGDKTWLLVTFEGATQKVAVLPSQITKAENFKTDDFILEKVDGIPIKRGDFDEEWEDSQSTECPERGQEAVTRRLMSMSGSSSSPVGGGMLIASGIALLGLIAAVF